MWFGCVCVCVLCCRMFATVWTPDATVGIDTYLSYDDALRAKVFGVGYQAQSIGKDLCCIVIC